MQAWRYSVCPGYGDWAVFFLSENGEFASTGAYGNYGHYWPDYKDVHPDFRAFLAGCDLSYLERKLGPEKVYSQEKATRAVKRSILDARRERRISKTTAKAYWDDLRHVGVRTESDLAELMDDAPFGLEYDYLDYPESFKTFLQKLVPVLQEKLKEQLKAEEVWQSPLTI